jgi:antitoxin component YwqK of YwqJK toxin-antitoxin module
MKKDLTALVLSFFVITAAHTQKIEKYFDYNWKECAPDMARFYGLIQKTDSGWLKQDYFLIEKKLQMEALYQDSACTKAIGEYYMFYPNGKLQTLGKYSNNEKQGLWISLYPDGFMQDSTIYENGQPVGVSKQWHENGFLSDSTIYNPDGSAVRFSWFDDGNIAAAGRLNPLGHLQGKWQYFHYNGKLSALETYNNDVLVNKQYFSEDGTQMQDTTDHTRKAEFKGGVNGWLRWLEKNLYPPANFRITNADKGTVITSFVIDKEGKLSNIYLPVPFFEPYNDIVLRVFRSSPKWIPAFEHNRAVKYRHKQSITFVQTGIVP